MIVKTYPNDMAEDFDERQNESLRKSEVEFL